jgi:hypothetical protein
MKNKVILKIHNFDCSIEDINKIIGIQPSKFWLIGDPIPGAKRGSKRKSSSWQFLADVPETSLISEHVTFMIDFISSRCDSLNQLSKKYESEFTVVSYCRGDQEFNFGSYFDTHSIKILSQAGLNLDLDVYFLPSAEN